MTLHQHNIELAEGIQAYWAARGYRIQIEAIVPAHNRDGHIRSNMVNGWPRIKALGVDRRIAA